MLSGGGAAPAPPPPEDEGAGRIARLQRALPLWLAVGAAVALAVGVLGDAGRVAAALAAFRWELAPAILGLTLLNYLLRLAKWHAYLRLIGAGHVPLGESVLIFFAGLSMTITPGKVGEWVKSYLLSRRHGVPFSASAPIILAERLTDGVAMLLLALGGLSLYGYGLELSLIVFVGAGAVVLFTQVPAFPLALIGAAERVPLLAARAHHAHSFFESARRLLRLPALTAAIAVGVVSWGGECLAFYFVLLGLGVADSPPLLVQAAFVLAVSTLAGSVSMLPGGLAVAEGSLAGMLLLLGVTGDTAIAAAATLIIRIATLWFGTAVGVGALALIARR